MEAARDIHKTANATRSCYQTGAQALSRFQFDEAEVAYDLIRQTDDVAEIAKHTKISIERVKRIKDHLFNKTHALDDGVLRFDAHPLIANAWHRVQA